MIGHAQLKFVMTDHNMGFWLLLAISTGDAIIKYESFSSRADNGRGLILRAMAKSSCFNLFITYSNMLFLVSL